MLGGVLATTGLVSVQVHRGGDEWTWAVIYGAEIVWAA